MATITETYTTEGTFQRNVPSGAVSVKMKLIGGGGPGEGKTLNGNGAGGAGGTYVESDILLDGISVLDIVVAGTKSGTTGDGGQGNESKVSSGGITLALAKGGWSAGSGNPGLGDITGCIGTIKRAGGNGAAGTSSFSGAGGGAAGDAGNGGNASNPNGGTSGGTNSGIGANSAEDEEIANTNGLHGSNYGGGGSGACKNTTGNPTGGNGAPGAVVLIYTVVENIPKHHFIL